MKARAATPATAQSLARGRRHIRENTRGGMYLNLYSVCYEMRSIARNPAKTTGGELEAVVFLSKGNVRARRQKKTGR
jgi:hypothetical protein